jgi:hypothetical protein
VLQWLERVDQQQQAPDDEQVRVQGEAGSAPDTMRAEMAVGMLGEDFVCQWLRSAYPEAEVRGISRNAASEDWEGPSSEPSVDLIAVSWAPKSCVRHCLHTCSPHPPDD